MALISCRECSQPVSTEAAACPHCGAPPQRTAPPPLPVKPPQLQQKEDIFYQDNVVIVASTRVVVGGTIYALRNITSVRMTYTPPRVGGAIVLLLLGIFILLLAFATMNTNAPAPIVAYPIAGLMIVGAILAMKSAKTEFHIKLASAAGEIQAVSSKNKTYIERIVLCINEAMTRCQ